jgi:hypothetical protein
MGTRLKSLAGLGFIAVICGGLSACADSGVDVEINAPILDAVGVNLMGKPAPAPNLPDRAPLVMPPKNAALPAPGEAPVVMASNGQQWPTDPEERKKAMAKAAKAEEERICREGNFSNKATIEDFRKNTGQEVRCRPEWVKNALGQGKAQE